ncbi:MAG: WD40 repeat domain-containing protein [Treponema sp.]|nr:WD40 repeat domain-containing protein [Treponema sp.]
MLFVLAVSVYVSMPASAQDAFPASGGHRGAIRSIIYNGSHIITAGADGFVEFWNVQHSAAEGRFQISVLPLKMMRLRPERPHLAIVESNGKQFRVSAWNYETKERLFAMDFDAEPAYINYSGAGSFLIVSMSDLSGSLCLNGDTGELLYTVPNTAGSVALAATGKSETSMISYMPSGTISYWSLSENKEIQHSKTVVGLQKPILFGNNRFIAGIGSGSSEGRGLCVIDAVTGKILDYEPRIGNGVVSAVQSDSPDFICISEDANRNQTLHSFTINSLKKLEPRYSPRAIEVRSRIESLTVVQDSSACGTTDGNVWLFNPDGSSLMLAVRNPLLIDEIAVAGDDTLFFLVHKTVAAIPLDWRLVAERGISFSEKGFSHITAAKDGVIVWNEHETKPRYLAVGTRSIELPFQSGFPLRTVTSLNGKALLLDAVGEITVISLETYKSVFSFSSAGSVDAAFLDDRHIIVGRGDGIAPFLKINLVTGETVPLAYPASVGVRVYRAASGVMYGGVITQERGEQKTVLLRFDMTDSMRFRIVAEAHGENLTFAIAETGGIAVSTLSSGQAAMALPLGGRKPYTHLEQKGGFPVHLVDGGAFFISVDTDGVISWHDPHTGFLLAHFRLYADGWTIEQSNGAFVRGRY